MLRVGDELVGHRSSPTRLPSNVPLSRPILEDGTITLLYNQKFQAAGKTIGQLEQEIQDRYVPDYFTTLPSRSPSSAEPHFTTVGGEVNAPAGSFLPRP